ncbi:MAG: alpha/beta hydrolase [Pseudobacteriovorax sp.]|nr:alpha/beta hydrolase [Pseudobacteriovorax sp.]
MVSHSLFIPVEGSHNLEVITNKYEQRSPAILFLPGMSGSANTWANDLDLIPDTFALTMSFRGRGKSSSPNSGYGHKHHAEDIKSVCSHFQLKRPIIVANSASSYWSLLFAQSYRIGGLIIIDKLPASRGIPEETLTIWLKDVNLPFSNEVAKALHGELKPEDGTHLLHNLDCKTTLLFGGKKGSHITEDELIFLSKYHPDLRQVKLPNSGHGVALEDTDILVNEIHKLI